MNRVRSAPGSVRTGFRAFPEGVRCVPRGGALRAPTIHTMYGPSNRRFRAAVKDVVPSLAPEALGGHRYSTTRSLRSLVLYREHFFLLQGIHLHLAVNLEKTGGNWICPCYSL